MKQEKEKPLPKKPKTLGKLTKPTPKDETIPKELLVAGKQDPLSGGISTQFWGELSLDENIVKFVNKHLNMAKDAFPKDPTVVAKLVSKAKPLINWAVYDSCYYGENSTAQNFYLTGMIQGEHSSKTITEHIAAIGLAKAEPYKDEWGEKWVDQTLMVITFSGFAYAFYLVKQSNSLERAVAIFSRIKEMGMAMQVNHLFQIYGECEEKDKKA